LHERTGLVIPPKNPRAIGEAALRLARDHELRKRFGAAARNRVEQEFSIDRCVSAHAELYEQLLTKVPAKSTKARTLAPAHARSSARPLMFAYWGRYGALGQFTLELADVCSRIERGSQTTFSVSISSELFPEYDKFGEAIFSIDTYNSPAAALNMAAVLVARRRLTKRLLADGTRAFVTLMPHVWSPLVTTVLRKAGVRHTVVVHDANPHIGDRTALVNRWLLREARRADQVVTLTSSVAEDLIRSKIVAEKKISVLFHPDLTYEPGVPNAKGHTEPLRVLFFGRILPYKGLGEFIGAMEILKQAGLPIEAGVFGSGDIGPDRERLERLGAEIVNKWIPSAEVAGILARHDVLVASHTTASQSGVIAAAHGAGLPVVTTPVGGLTEQIIPEVTGLVAADTGAQAIAAAIRRLAEDRDLLQRIRRNITETKEERSMERFFRELSEIAQKGN
jgi:glycosyltransferase involved in cell wall biosynthesis